MLIEKNNNNSNNNNNNNNTKRGRKKGEKEEEDEEDLYYLYGNFSNSCSLSLVGQVVGIPTRSAYCRPYRQHYRRTVHVGQGRFAQDLFLLA